MTPAERVAFLTDLAAKLCHGRGADTEDLVQDVLEKLLRTPLPADLVDERAWLTRVTRNRFIDSLRRRAARREVPREHEAPAPEPAASPWEAFSEADVRARLDALPRAQSETFALFALDGCSYIEIARRLAISKATVGTRILRARARLRELLAA